MPTDGTVRFLVFDVESAADGKLVAEIRYPEEHLEPAEAIARYRQQRLQETGSEFIPHTFQFPISIVVAKIDAQFRLIDLVALDEPRFRPHIITEYFWRGWERYGRPTLVSFNGRGFDIPLLELAAFRYGISVPAWFDTDGKTWNQPRNRYNTHSHLDLQELLVNFGAVRFSGGLNLAASLLGKPGKMELNGNMVQQLYDEGKRHEISQYCRCDVLDTYFVFLRSQVLTGTLVRDREEQLVAETKSWLLDRADEVPAFATYLDHWADWPNPWKEVSHETSSTPTEAAAEAGR
jgi:predicted PolB exonuclease-like 3'-5' exonuclease